MDFINLVAISHKDEFVSREIDGIKRHFRFSAKIYDFEYINYTELYIFEHESNNYNKMEFLDNDQEKAIKRVLNLSSIFEPFDVKILTFDNNYSPEFVENTYNKWIGNE